MPRKRRDEEVVLSALKRWIADKDCPYVYRIYSTVLLGVATRMFDPALIALMPGAARYKLPQEVKEPMAAEETAPQEVDVTGFLKSLGGADANPQT